MKKYCRYILGAFALWFPMCAECFCTKGGESSCTSGFEVEAKISAFFPSSHTVRRIFSNVIPFYELEIAQSFYNHWQVWLGAGYLSDHGHAFGCNNRTSFRLIPVTLGLKYLYPVTSCGKLYAGAGPTWGFLKNKDHSPYVHEHVSKQSLGGIFKLGFIYQVKQCIFIDVFTEYLYQHFSFHQPYDDHYTVRNNLNLSGLKLGGGLGFNF